MIARALFLVHRYLGIAVGLLMVMWCLSGMIMIYVPYPQLTETDRLAHLAPIDWHLGATLHVPEGLSDFPLDKVQLEMLAGSPVLRWRNTAHQMEITSAITGAPITISPAQALTVAQPYVDSGTQPRLIDRIDHDQWTVQGALGADRPLYHFALGDAAGTELYVSSVTGKAVQMTTARQRLWNWLGTVPHWIYFSSLRQHPELWSSVVVWTSTAGCFLTITGLYLGIRQCRPRSVAGWLPYRGYRYWHHLLGLIFGVFLLTWVASGLISMNPWGFLGGMPSFEDFANLRGSPPDPSMLEAGLLAFAATPESRTTVSIETAPINGQLFLIATDGSGTRLRMDAHGHRAMIDSRGFAGIAALIARNRPVQSQQLITAEDPYYFGHHREQAPLPAYRIILNDVDHTHYYIDAITGQIGARIDHDAQWYRWLHQAPHRFDFGTAFRGSIARELSMLALLAGMSAISGLGVYLGACRLRRKRRGHVGRLSLPVVQTEDSHPS